MSIQETAAQQQARCQSARDDFEAFYAPVLAWLAAQAIRFEVECEVHESGTLRWVVFGRGDDPGQLTRVLLLADGSVATGPDGEGLTAPELVSWLGRQVRVQLAGGPVAPTWLTALTSSLCLAALLLLTTLLLTRGQSFQDWPARALLVGVTGAAGISLAVWRWVRRMGFVTAGVTP